MSEQITSHIAPGDNEGRHVAILANGERGPGNAYHNYTILWNRRTREDEPGIVTGDQLNIRFQNGGIQEAGLNGVTNEALLAVVQNRLEGFQSGKFACETNATALHHIQAALDALHSRTLDRLQRGVEGKQVE